MVLSLSTVNHVEEIVSRAQADGRAPAVAAGVVRDGSLALFSSAGERPVPDRDTQFRIGSITKSLTAAVLLGLRDEQRLGLDDPIGEHVPDLAAAVGALRLRQLLGHAAGLQREPDGAWWERSVGVPPAQLHADTTAAKVAFEPYLRFHYSNLAYGLLGSVIERVTGQAWYAAVRDRLLDPLGMRRTTYEPQEPFARGYVLHPWSGTVREEPRLDAHAMAPAGQLWSTVENLARWAAVLASAPPGGGLNAGSVLAESTVAEMAAPVVIADPDEWSAGYGLGLQLRRYGNRVYCGHTGSMPGYLAVLWVHRPSRTGVVAYANAYSLRDTTISDLGVSIVEAVLDSEPVAAPPPWRPAAPEPDDVAPLCGRWWWMGREFELRWEPDTGLLALSAPGEGSWFRPLGEDRWVGVAGREVGEILTVLRDGSGAVDGLDVATFRYRRVPMADD